MIRLTSSQLRDRGIACSDAELALREAEDDEPVNAEITLANGATVRVWLIDSERKALGFKVDELQLSWSAPVIVSDEPVRAERSPLSDEHRAKLRAAWERRRAREREAEQAP